MKKYLLFIILLFIGIFCFTKISLAAVIFSDNYDSAPDGWICADGVLSGYTGQSACSSDVVGGVTRYYGEITSGSCRTGNCLKLWRHNGGFTEYGGYLDKNFTSSEFNNHYKELFVRWYVKIPTDWDANLGGAHTHKLERIYSGTSAGEHTMEWYMDVKGGASFKNSKFSFYNTKEGNVWYTDKTITQLGVNDGNWHSLEWHVKLNSTAGNSDGGWNFYVDGVEQIICDGIGNNCHTGQSMMDMGSSADEYFTSGLPPAIGNLSDGTWNFPTAGWYSFMFDDYVISTTYIGPDSGGTCSCSSWQNGSCRAGGCASNQRQQTRTCTPSGCNTVSQCVTDTSCTSTKIGDLNNDNLVNVIDLGILLSNWGSTSRPSSDLNSDGNVNVIDLGILLSNWG
jgi:hypothetical protein